jgi:hypothetical protein
VSKARPKIELLWWRGCPSWERALGELREAVEEAGLESDSIEAREVLTQATADEAQFVGSPTIRIDGEDVQPPGPDEPAGLTCRIYRQRDGRVSPLPDPEDVRDALQAAIDADETKERSRA